MWQTYRKLYELMTNAERRKCAWMLLLNLVIALFEMIGVASVIPFIAVVANPEVVETNRYLALIYETLGFQSTESFLFWLGVGFLLVLLVSLGMRALGFWVQQRFNNQRIHDMSCRVIAASLSQPYLWFLDRHSVYTGNAAVNEITQVINGGMQPAVQLIAHSFIVLALCTLLVLVDPLLTLAAALVLGGSYSAIFLVFRKRVARLGERRRLLGRGRAKTAQEVFGGIKDVKIAGLEVTSLERFARKSSELAAIATSQGLLSQMPRFAMQGLVYGGTMLALLYLLSVHDAIQEALPTIAVFALATYRLLPSLQMLYAQAVSMRSVRPFLDSVHSTYPSFRSTKLNTEEAAPMPLRRAIEFRNVTFRYPNTEQPVVRDLSLTIPLHASVGLVGSTGSGKTTLADLLLGLLPVTEGAILVDGVALDDGNIRSWQRALGYVPQQIFLADDTVAANIAFGLPRERVDMAAVERAAKIAMLHDFVMEELPLGYDSRIGERGIRLSGGQRQRIGIARALYHDPDVIIMDEATSALDNLTERAVMDAVDNLSRQKTIILIAHRLSTVRGCDTIFMMNKGELMAQGTYNELVASNLTFRAMAMGES
jgi:ATP-binding cassette, subfamily B, bacterial PglK